MEYSKIVAITGISGLFELLSTKSDGALVKSIDDGNVKFVSGRVHNFSQLESIEVYTVRENVNLTEIFKAMQESGETLPDEKDAKAVKAYFEKVYPDMDFERVYASDMKKMVKWLKLLSEKNIEIKILDTTAEDAEDSVNDTPGEADAVKNA